jgi:hypothetical protein
MSFPHEPFKDPCPLKQYLRSKRLIILVFRVHDLSTGGLLTFKRLGHVHEEIIKVSYIMLQH